MFLKTAALIKGLILILMIFSQNSFGAACTDAERTNVSANSILTSNEYNSSLNTIYGAFNDLIGATCTIGKDSLTATEFSPLFDSFRNGCEVTYNNASTVSIAPCKLAVNENWVDTTTSATLAFGCADCDAEANSQDFYVYVKSGSEGTTLTPFLSTTAPGSFGEDGSNNKVIGKIFNDSTGDIASLSVQNYFGDQFIADTQAGFLGSVEWPEITNCRWRDTTLNAWTNYSPDSDCDNSARTCLGPLNTTDCDAAASDGTLPKIEFSSIPKGHVKIFLSGSTSCSDTGGSVCRVFFRFTDGTNVSLAQQVYFNGSEQENGDSFFIGEFEYKEDQSSLSYSVQYYIADGDQASLTALPEGGGDSENRGIRISVYHYPLKY